MIVFTGDWVKFLGQWKQVVSVNVHMDMFATIDSDGEFQWFGTESPEVFENHISDVQMQIRLQELGL